MTARCAPDVALDRAKQLVDHPFARLTDALPMC